MLFAINNNVVVSQVKTVNMDKVTFKSISIEDILYFCIPFKFPKMENL